MCNPPSFYFFAGEQSIMKESQFQAELIQDLKRRFPGCMVMKNDANYIQGVPDLIVLYRDKWALLEVKRAKDSPKRSLQDYYIDWANVNSFGQFICPENKEEVLNELERSFRTHR